MVVGSHNIYNGMRMSRPRRSPVRPTVAQPDGPKPHELVLVDEMDPEAIDYVRQAVSALFKQKIDPKYPLTAEEVVSTLIARITGIEDWKKWNREIWLKWKTTMNVVKDAAIADPRYYGITDPVNQRYCTGCRKVLPVKEFPGDRLRCHDCGSWRNDAEI